MPPPDELNFEFTPAIKRFRLLHEKSPDGIDHSRKRFDETLDVFDSEVLDGFKTRVRRALKLSDSEMWAPFDRLLSTYLGVPAAPETIVGIYWRLAAGYDWLLEEPERRLRFVMSMSDYCQTGDKTEDLVLYKEFKPWACHWVPLQVEEVAYSRPSKKGTTMLSLGFRLLGGPFSGLQFVQRIPYNFTMYKLARDIGFPRFKPLHPLELTQAVFVGLMETVEEPRIIEFHATTRSKSFNLRLRRERAKPCIKGYGFKCHKCPIGHSMMMASPCPRGTHPRSYYKRECPLCQKESWFDPGSGSKVCVPCTVRELKTAGALERV